MSKMSDKTFDTLKMICMTLGYLGTFVLTLSDIWGWEMGAPVAASLSALCIFISGILKSSSDAYWDIHSIVEKGDGDDDGE